jgi:hypothetical protein
MRIFVTGTGRCGTVTFSKAAGHATNYTVGHETHAGKIGQWWDYPDNHIEVSSHLVLQIPLLLARYPEARWVHLLRADQAACIESIASMRDGGVVRDYCRVFCQVDAATPILRSAGAELIYDQLNALVRALLPNAFVLTLEYAHQRWVRCWGDFMACEGDFAASLAEWDIHHNARTEP